MGKKVEIYEGREMPFWIWVIYDCRDGGLFLRNVFTISG